ncbi:hypothetical protein PINS_up015453 [Pythium insidiosum]|nr:hypothetical protein PINS_up015453 [Pythium insidiosum]
MMAMTPQDKKKLEEIEAAFLEALEPRSSNRQLMSSSSRHPSFPVDAAITKKSAAKSTPPRGWWSSLKERIMMRAVCCAPPTTLLDDGELDQLLAAVEQPVKPKPIARVASRAERFARRPSATVMPVVVVSESRSHVEIPINATSSSSGDSEMKTTAEVTTVEYEMKPIEPTAMSDVDQITDTESSEEETDDITPELRSPSTRRTLLRVRTALTFVRTVQRHVIKRRMQAASVIQRAWRRQRAAAQQSRPVEPEGEPEIVEPQLDSPTRRRRRQRSRKIRRAKKTKLSATTDDIPQPEPAIDNCTAIVVFSPQVEPLARKRSRSVHDERAIVPVDVERDVHALFGDEQIDDDEFVCVSPRRDEALSTSREVFTMAQRCCSVPPPPTALRPVAVRSRAVREQQAALVLQCAWRCLVARQQTALRRRMRQFEQEKRSVMPTIRAKMIELRRRLEELQETRSSLSDGDIDDFDWL